ncbi:MAG: 16S rRNA processing protein RimM [Clostridia bacterium]|nr:16S rRNA processing protein RimM [Clostridia bacterium]
MGAFMELGYVNNVRGLRGEIKVIHYCDYKEFFEELDSVIIKNTEYEIESIKYYKDQVVLKLAGIDTIELAETLKNQTVYAEKDALPPLPDGVFYIADLIGVKAYLEDGTYVGEVTDVIQNGPTDVLELKNDDGKQILIPRVTEFVPYLSVTEKKMTITPIEGLL